MGKFQRSIRDLFKRGRKSTEGSTSPRSSSEQSIETNEGSNANDMEGAQLALAPSRTEAWPWHTAAGDLPKAAEPIGSECTLSAARSETWPWSVGVADTDSKAEAVAEGNRNNYFDVLQSASRRGYQAPPRHEVQEYQHKALPPPPPIRDSSSVAPSRPSSVNTASRQPTMPSSRLSMSVDPTSNSEDAQIYHSETVSAQLKWQTSHHMVSERQSTWVSRLERRAENDRKGRALLTKVPEGEVPEHGM